MLKSIIIENSQVFVYSEIVAIKFGNVVAFCFSKFVLRIEGRGSVASSNVIYTKINIIINLKCYAIIMQLNLSQIVFFLLLNQRWNSQPD